MIRIANWIAALWSILCISIYAYGLIKYEIPALNADKVPYFKQISIIKWFTIIWLIIWGVIAIPAILIARKQKRKLRNPEFVNCPMCMETIKYGARKCKHCGSFINNIELDQ